MTLYFYIKLRCKDIKGIHMISYVNHTTSLQNLSHFYFHILPVHSMFIDRIYTKGNLLDLSYQIPSYDEIG